MKLEQYPRVYSVDARTRRDVHAIALSVLAFTVALTVLRFTGLTSKAVTPSALLVMVVVAGIWALLLSSPFHRRVILHEDGIEVKGWFSTRKLNRSEILGCYIGGTDPRNPFGGAHYVIVPMDKAERVLRFPPHLKMDEDFRAWMETVPKIVESGRSNS